MSLFSRSSRPALAAAVSLALPGLAWAGPWRCGELVDSVDSFGAPAVVAAIERGDREVPDRVLTCLVRRGVPSAVVDAARAVRAERAVGAGVVWVDLPEVEGAEALNQGLTSRFGDGRPWAVWFRAPEDDLDWADWAFDGAAMMWTALLRKLPAETADVAQIEALTALGGADELRTDPPWRPGDLANHQGAQARRHEAERALRRAGFGRLLEVSATADGPGLRVRLRAWELRSSGREEAGVVETLLLPGMLAQPLAVKRRGRQVELAGPGGEGLAGWHLRIFEDGVELLDRRQTTDSLRLRVDPTATLEVLGTRDDGAVARASLQGRAAPTSSGRDAAEPEEAADRRDEPGRDAGPGAVSGGPPASTASTPTWFDPKYQPGGVARAPSGSLDSPRAVARARRADARAARERARRDAVASREASREGRKIARADRKGATRADELDAGRIRHTWVGLGFGLHAGAIGSNSAASFRYTPPPTVGDLSPASRTTTAGAALGGLAYGGSDFSLQVRLGPLRLQGSVAVGQGIVFSGPGPITNSLIFEPGGAAALGWAGGRVGLFGGWRVFYRSVSGELFTESGPGRGSAIGLGAGPALFLDVRVSRDDARMTHGLTLMFDYALQPLGGFAGDWRGGSGVASWVLRY